MPLKLSHDKSQKINLALADLILISSKPLYKDEKAKIEKSFQKTYENISEFMFIWSDNKFPTGTQKVATRMALYGKGTPIIVNGPGPRVHLDILIDDIIFEIIDVTGFMY